MREKSAFLNFSVLICVFIFYTETQADNNFDLECALVPHNKFVRNPNSCKDYFKCSDGRIALKGSCPEQLLFNDLTQGCDFPNKVNCQSCNTDFGLQHFVDSRNCSNFYKCVHNVKKHFRCPDNMYFDFGSSSCLDKEFVDCEFTPMVNSVFMLIQILFLHTFFYSFRQNSPLFHRQIMIHGLFQEFQPIDHHQIGVHQDRHQVNASYNFVTLFN